MPLALIMAGGGESIKVEIHDLAIIVGAIGLVGAIVIAFFALPMAIDLGEATSTQSVRTLSIGQLGSNDEVVISATPLCGNNESCAISIVKLIDEDGNEITSQSNLGAAEDGSFSTTLSAPDGGAVTAQVTGVGEWEMSVTAQRQIPIQFTPSLFALLLLVWGIWRKTQDTGDRDIDEVVDTSI